MYTNLQTQSAGFSVFLYDILKVLFLGRAPHNAVERDHSHSCYLVGEPVQQEIILVCYQYAEGLAVKS